MKEQTLYYLGIPLNLSYRLWAYKGLKVYASAGGQADWNAWTKLQINGVTLEMDKDRMHTFITDAFFLRKFINSNLCSLDVLKDFIVGSLWLTFTSVSFNLDNLRLNWNCKLIIFIGCIKEA